MESYVIELPDACTGPADDLWAIEFRTAERMHWIHNTPRSTAEEFYADWKAGSTARVRFCKLCPTSRNSNCSHDELPEQRGWLFLEMTKVRIMPMREAI